jgi:ABC-type dipeptide/oligopeptide/nickel transport system permease subunit
VTARPWGRIAVRLSLGWLGLVVACAIFAGLVPEPAPAAGIGGGLGEVCARSVLGARTTVLFVLAVTLIGVPLGAMVGGLAGTGSRMAEFGLARGVELFGAWPSVILVALVRLVTPSGSILGLVLLFGLLRAVHLARLVRGETLRLAASDFAWAARALGVGRVRLLGRHLLPHLRGLVLAQTALGAAWVVALETGLTTAGLGLSRDWSSWGLLLGNARALGLLAAALPATAVVLTSLSCAVLADAIDDGRGPRRGPAASPASALRPEIEG